MSAPGPAWSAEEENLLRSLAAAGESAVAIATLLKRSHHAVRKRAHLLEIKLARSPPGPKPEVEMTYDDPNEAYEVVPIEPGPHGPPHVKRNGLPVRLPGKEKAERFATDPEYRASLAAGKAWEKAKGK
jgi:hypothetical protein